MNNKEDIITINSKGKMHGYQERYCHNIGELKEGLYLRCNAKNDLAIGYCENHLSEEIFFFID